MGTVVDVDDRDDNSCDDVDIYNAGRDDHDCC